ncbi:protein of unknown function [Methylorubrum extorquens DM4]|uniref:Uncharacterized protein n=1 Tax=Methylorubrum extorquens (strain DSM 6343 / CIP 106787 / DM4) TaxID=661410 RepID=C7CHM7_METED|nr:protein of unknown function [Methylorubrum extorquens DM4]
MCPRRPRSRRPFKGLTRDVRLAHIRSRHRLGRDRRGDPRPGRRGRLDPRGPRLTYVIGMSSPHVAIGTSDLAASVSAAGNLVSQ